ncbi:efflux RND transporter periplasmic adaptor subunit [Bradyrhizobium sp. GCM10027634]|uniref:efflux RND transporter periplasmic adaptor subunit n=1 Tax=unclassified Bradyrhizobium TaxID=2631580 RepID=UPI00263B6ED1|nr:efflux RND transporter periplasmic adaptor subunit [Bradyrhizobium sp. WYCCWR 12677]MDN5005289.1 efflux RND transporter periplasmic adaptor subunit [Bradyrhizobium sp. WYCCWR 12677]
MTTASPIYSFAEDATRAESVAWAKFSAARDKSEFCTSWLTILCMQVERVGGALLLLGPDKEGAYVPAAVWPHPGLDMQYLSPAAERTLTERRGVVVPSEGRGAFVGYPIEVSGVLHGVVVLDIGPSPDPTMQRALRLLHWASAWLIDQFRKGALEQREAQLTRMGLAMDIVATAMQERYLSASALGVANELASRLACDRVSLGLERSGSIDVKVISHTASFDPKMDLGRRIANAMDEVLDLDVALVFPPRDDVEQAALAHAELAREFRDTAVCSVPLLDDGHAIGVLTLERAAGEPFDVETIELCKTVGGLLGPIMKLRQENERNVLQHAGTSVRHGVEALFGPRHPGVKLIGLLAAAGIVFFTVATGTHRVAAKTVIEGAVQRIAAAPFEGYLAQSFVRAGDTVHAGQVLCKLDDRELKLDQARLSSEREQLDRKYRQALASQERATMAILQAQIEQVDAMSSLIADKLARATLLAPFDGIVVAGDLHQLLGTPVELGKVLFTIAPLDSYRVILQVEERDVSYLKVGQQGELTLSGIPHRQMGFSVEQITPVSTAQDGRNFFRVEARLFNASDRVRPGMEGVGKVDVDERKLIWIWTHNLIDWVRLSVWKWLF